MILLDKPAGGAVLLIGRGLLGGAIVEQLQRSGCEVATTLPVPWDDCPELCRRLEEMLSQAGFGIVAFAQDLDGEIYAIGFSGGIHRLVDVP